MLSSGRRILGRDKVKGGFRYLLVLRLLALLVLSSEGGFRRSLILRLIALLVLSSKGIILSGDIVEGGVR